MGNCLVTKLKGTVDNPNLPILGAIDFTVKAGNFSVPMNVPVGTVVEFDNTVDVINNGSGAGSQITSPWTVNIPVSPTANNIRLNGTLTRDTKFTLKNAKYGTNYILKQDSTAVYIVPLNFAEVAKYNEMVKFGGTKVESEVPGGVSISEILGNNTLIAFGFDTTSKSPIKGNFSDLQRFINLVEIRFNNSKNSVVGNIASLSPLTKLTVAQLQRNSQIQGRLEDLIEAMCVNRVGTVENPETLAIDIRYTAATFKEIAPELTSNAQHFVHFFENSVVVKNVDDIVIGTYNKTDNTWTYA